MEKERTGGKSEQRFALSRIYHSSHPANGWPFSPADSGPVSPPLWNRYSLLFLPAGRAAPPPPQLWSPRFPSRGNATREEERNRSCCRNGIGLISVGDPRIWLNSRPPRTPRRIRLSGGSATLELDQPRTPAREDAPISKGKFRQLT